jgi:hypothetical protein
MRLGRVLLSLGIATAASCSFYTMPTLDLVIRLDETAGAGAVPESVRRFAQSKGLQEFELKQGVPAGVEEQPPPTTYWHNPERASRGTGVMYFDLSPRCKVVRLLEEAEDWSPETRAAVVELEQRLSRLDGVRVEPGNSLANWRETMKSPESYCMNEQANPA